MWTPNACFQWICNTSPKHNIRKYIMLMLWNAIYGPILGDAVTPTETFVIKRRCYSGKQTSPCFLDQKSSTARNKKEHYPIDSRGIVSRFTVSTVLRPSFVGEGAGQTPLTSDSPCTILIKSFGARQADGLASGVLVCAWLAVEAGCLPGQVLVLA